ncbi:transcriptional regulator, MarR family [Catenulispora acidiphila DSM 44928]|uniref:Transcriptional regulator, MarR family n=1 Tax=Catenulispora acidiphila (strain DSM 44928 / JCM 14897 / NBRC 102108 / NRRL B-24433 / ID139908) TaxID=479433 RepID=C7PX01_CATAD|nr:helix-turn-helix domain-containing protein [Catenulispora acidiphila]ACU77258.1 transcriptional regulator, MarR family [Catenulispora acidiphila DSM 44928]
MITVELGLDELAATSFACSALLETGMSLRMWTHPGYYAEQVPLFNRMRPAFERLDTELLTALVGSWRWIPDFLTPRPTTPWPDFHRELATLRATPVERIWPELEQTFVKIDGAVPARLLRGRRDPAGLLAEIADEFEAYWETCLAPEWWPRARSVLESDIVYRARMLVERGAGTLFGELGDRLSWDGRRLRITWDASAYAAAVPKYDVPATGHGVLLAPTCFAHGALSMIEPTLSAWILYPARGLGTMAERVVPPPAGPALERLLGAPRARMLLMLGEPVSTTELARQLGVTPGAVSQHLKVLLDAGLTSRARHGRSVLYARSPLGDSLAGIAPPGLSHSGARRGQRDEDDDAAR